MEITIIMLVLIVGMFWFTSRSSKKREQEAANMRDSLAVGDEVTTIGGIIGKVVSIKGETFVLETTKQRTQIRFLKGAIRCIDVKAADLAAAAMEAKESTAATENTDAKTAPLAVEAPKAEEKNEAPSRKNRKEKRAEAAVKAEESAAPVEATKPETAGEPAEQNEAPKEEN